MNAVDAAEAQLQRGGHAHLVGVGGIGMAGVAYLLLQRGVKVSGCDRIQNRQTEWLATEGAIVSVGHDASHITGGVDWVIRSTAIPDDHPEVVAARNAGLPISRRGEVLPALLRDRYTIAVSGTHGKTTTTGMIAQVLNCGFCIGGERVDDVAVARDGAMMVVEADESDGTVAGYTPDVAVITNIEFDHMEHHRSEAAFVACFEHLRDQTRERVIYCAEDPVAQALCSAGGHVPYGYPEEPFELPFPGRHHQLNAAAALTVCQNWLSESVIRERLACMQPIRRRFEMIAEANGMRVISDYAHHPTEIRALIQTAKTLKPERIMALFQPHRYTRTRALLQDFSTCFEGVDALWLVPVYAASEAPLVGGASADVAAVMQTPVCLSDSPLAAWEAIFPDLRAGDLLLVIGAGDVVAIAPTIAQALGGNGHG